MEHDAHLVKLLEELRRRPAASNELLKLVTELHERDRRLSDQATRALALQPPDSRLCLSVAGPGGRKTAIDLLAEFTAEAEVVTVIDPYFYTAKPETEAGYVADLSRALSLDRSRPKRVHIIYDHKNRRDARSTFWEEAANKNAAVTEKRTRDIHDRIWIADDQAKLVGASFNGWGGKLFFIVDLPNEDREELDRFLAENDLAPR